MNYLFGCIIGYIATFAFLICLLYSILKRKKIKNILNFHCIIGIIAVVFSLIHVSMEHDGISSAFGTICLITMIAAGITGLLMKYFNKIYKRVFIKIIHVSSQLLLNIRIILRYIHIASCILFIISLLLHILIFYLI